MQTSVSTAPARGFAGQNIFPGLLNEIVARQIDDTDGVVDAGLFVTRASSDVTVKAPVTAAGITTANVGGVVIYSPGREAGTYVDGDLVSIAKKGYILMVAAAGSYTKGQAVNVRYAGTGTKGSVTQTAVTDETAVLPSATVDETKTLSAAGLVLVRLDG